MTQTSPNAAKLNDLEALGQTDEPLSSTVGGSVTDLEKIAIVKTLDHYGWNQSAGVRTVMLAFVRSVAVRDAVLEHLHNRAA